MPVCCSHNILILFSFMYNQQRPKIAPKKQAELYFNQTYALQCDT